MKLKFNIKVKDLVNGGYFEAGEVYDIANEQRVRLILGNKWAEAVEVKPKVEPKVEMTEGTGDSSPAPRGRKPKVE